MFTTTFLKFVTDADLTFTKTIALTMTRSVIRLVICGRWKMVSFTLLYMILKKDAILAILRLRLEEE